MGTLASGCWDAHRSARPQVIERFTLEDLPAESGQDRDVGLGQVTGYLKIKCLQKFRITLTLVGGLEHEFYDFPYIGNVIIPTDSYFSEG